MQISEIIKGFEGISLDEMDSARLMNRTDRKFILHKDALPEILNDLMEEYRVLEIDNKRVFSYATSYFDTEDYRFYRLHHSGKKNRHKVRFRSYLDTGTQFLEVKFKNNKGRTIKHRTVVDEVEEVLSGDSKHFIQELSGLSPDLVQVLKNKFQRLTLVHRDGQERATFDFNMSYDGNDPDKEMPWMVIAEIKQSAYDRSSCVMKSLKRLGIREQSISKYCMGIALGNPKIKQNRFKEKLMKIQKLRNEPYT